MDIDKTEKSLEFALSEPLFNPISLPIRKIVIRGSGHLGTYVLSGARAAGLEVMAFSDNDPALWGRQLAGVPVISPQAAVATYGHSAAFIVAIYNGSKIRQELSDMGCAHVVPYPWFFYQFSKFMPEEDRFELPANVASDVPAIKQAYALLEDETSRREFTAQILWRRTFDYAALPAQRPPQEIYFDSEIFKLKEEVFVDCGAFNGDSIGAFLSKCQGRFRSVYAIEPDSTNRAALESFLHSLPREQSSRCKILPYGLSDSDGAGHFERGGSPGARVSEKGEERVEIRKLDDLLTGDPPTLIKMDIEGAEPRALLGARDVIVRHRPVLTVCAYHRCEHLWTIPLLLKQMLPEYQIFLRRYAEDCWELVYYAVPLARR